jgi:hypothetical protein
MDEEWQCGESDQIGTRGVWWQDKWHRIDQSVVVCHGCGTESHYVHVYYTRLGSNLYSTHNDVGMMNPIPSGRDYIWALRWNAWMYSSGPLV